MGVKGFKKGQSGNPGGRPRLPEDLRKANFLTAQQFMELCHKMIHLTKDQLVAVIQNPGSTTLELMIASIIHKGVVQGDQKRLDFILDRMIGKVLQNHKVEGGFMPPQVFINLPPNGREDT